MASVSRLLTLHFTLQLDYSNNTIQAQMFYFLHDFTSAFSLRFRRASSPCHPCRSTCMASMSLRRAQQSIRRIEARLQVSSDRR